MNKNSKTRGLLDLIIALLPGLMPKHKILLLKTFNNEEDLFIQSKNDIERITGSSLKNFWDISEIRDKADRIDTICRMRSIKWVSWTNPEYPPLLREIYDPPAVLFYRGLLPNPEKSLLGMVGTRKPSPEAAVQAYTIAHGAGLAGISVVSGLALGIDAMSHRGNLSGGAPGYAIMGSGIDEIYPSSNKVLAKWILDSGGAIISEYHPGVRPGKWNFPARNRIIAAFSRSVLIVEAPLKSGALITASFALDQGKDLWVASSGIRQSGVSCDKRGTDKLANDGADVIYSSRDILDKWNMEIISNKAVNQRSDIVASMAKMLEIEL